MNDALKELMREEIEEEKQKAVDTAMIAAIGSFMQSFGIDATTAMDAMGIPASDQLRYAARL